MCAAVAWAEPVAVLGEAPLWDARHRRLHWVDCDQKLLFGLDPATGAVSRTELPHFPGSYAFRRGGGLVMAYRNRIVLADADGGEASAVETPGVDFAVERFNDGACDRRGRFWIGTMDRKLKEPVGNLFRLDPDLTFTRIETGLTASNGIAFSPDDRTMYHTDTGAARIYAYDFDLDSGAVTSRRVFAEFTHGRPDGCTIDADGHLWVAAINGGEVVRLDPEGRRVGAIALPVSRPTSTTFGGADLRTLYITTMRFGLSPEEQAAQPQAGCLFAAEVEVPGLPEPEFAG
jgi:sugar lactone lactonase YvrE